MTSRAAAGLAVALSLAVPVAVAPVGSALACWIHIPFDDLARTSNVIVAGRLRDVRQVEGPANFQDAGQRHYEATIEVERSFWPVDATAPTRTLRWSRPPEGSDVSTDRHHERLQGARLLWLLDRPAGEAGQESYLAGHPGRTVRLDDDTAVRAARLDIIAPRRPPAPFSRVTAPPEAWASDVPLEGLKRLFDQTLAQLDSARRSGR